MLRRRVCRRIVNGETLKALMGRGFELLQVLYDEMVWIDGKAEAEHFVHELMKELL